MKLDPEKMRDKLCANSSARKAESLRLIYKICAEQKTRGSADYSVATIGGLSSERGGPSAAAIRNKPGEDYRALIKAFADFVGGHSKKRGISSGDPVDDILEGITDPILRARLNLLLAEIRSMRAQLLAARHLANKVAVLDLDGLDNPAPEISSSASMHQGLSAQELEALDAALKPASLKHWGWIVDDAGRVLTETGQVVFRTGFATALDKTVKAANTKKYL